MDNKNNTEAVRGLLGKGWLTHDAMWVTAAYQECGPEIANKLNSRAIAMMTPIETKRFQEFLDLPEVDTFQKLQDFITGAFAVISGEFTDFRITFPEHNILRWHSAQCFAFDGISKIGLIDHYQCGIIGRLEGWLKALRLEYEILPKIEGCLMHNTGSCKLDIRFSFDQ